MDADDDTIMNDSQHFEPSAEEATRDGTPTTFEHTDDEIGDSVTTKVPKYHLRPPRTGRRVLFPTTWLDQDVSGNYGERDRGEELRRARRRENRVRQRGQAESRTTGENFDEGEADDEGSPEEARILIVTLSVRSDAGRTKYSEIVANSSRTQTEENLKERLRRRKGAQEEPKYCTENNLPKSLLALDLPKDLTGHPVARGCWSCLELSIPCPLLEDEHEWPCEPCQEDQNDCIIVTPPTYKRACERCRSRKGPCSYTYTVEHGEACEQCMADGYQCIAGPVRDTVRTRIRYDRDWTKFPLPKEKPFKIRRQAPTSIKPPTDESIDEESALENLNSIEPATEPYKAYSGSRVSGEGKRMSRAPTPIPDRPAKIKQLFKSGKAVTETIETRFCHPIEFDYLDKTNGDEPCHFCVEPALPLIGLGRRDVEVIELEDGKGFEEISGGHDAEGVENTKVCAGCTVKRLQIVVCQRHQLRPISGVNSCLLQEKIAIGQLFKDSHRANRRKWCAICPSLASYECCAPTTQNATTTCGLELCAKCMAELVGRHKGNLQDMLHEIPNIRTRERPYGLRADHELLLEDGLLMKYVLSRNQE